MSMPLPRGASGLLARLVPPIRRSYSNCGWLVKELQIEKRH
jgi:hypothetical protein